MGKVRTGVRFWGHHPKSHADELKHHRMLWKQCRMISAEGVSALSCVPLALQPCNSARRRSLHRSLPKGSLRGAKRSLVGSASWGT